MNNAIHIDTPPFSKKDYLRELDQEAIARFKKSDDRQMTLFPVSFLPWRVFSTTPVVYTKKILDVGRYGRIFIIEKNGKPISYTWETEPKKIQSMVANGVFEPESLTGKTLCAMGHYRAYALELVYEKGIVSNKHQEKMEILSFSQTRMKLLQPLERLINSDCSIEDIKIAFEKYKNTVNEYKKKLNHENLEKYDANIHSTFLTYLDNDLASIQQFESTLTPENIKSRLEAFGANSLMMTMRIAITQIIKQAQGINQNLTYGRAGYLPESLYKGEFNSTCEDALAALNNYECDLHNRVLPAHQGNFSAPETSPKQTNPPEKSKKLYLEFAPENSKALAAICSIEKADQIFYEDGKWVLKKENFEIFEENNTVTPLSTTRIPNWFLGHGAVENKDGYLKMTTDFLRGVVDFSWNVLSGAVLTPADILLGILGGLFDFEFSLIAKTRIYPVNPSFPSTYSDILNEITVGHRPLGFRMGLITGLTVKDIIVGMWNGIALAAKHLMKFPEFIQDDLYVGGKKDKNKKCHDILNELISEIETIKTRRKLYKDERNEYKKSEKVNDDFNVTKNDDRQFASPPYHLSSGEWDDISKGPPVLALFSNKVLQPMHAKDPFKGLIYTLFFFAGGATMLTADSMPLPAFYKNFTTWLGTMTAHTNNSQALSAALMQGQGAAMFASTLQDGTNSILGKLAGGAGGDLVDVGSLIVLAYFSSWCLNSMPGVDDTINKEMGSVAGVALTNYGPTMPEYIRKLCAPRDMKEVSNEALEEFREKAKKLSDLVKSEDEIDNKEIDPIYNEFSEIKREDFKKIINQSRFFKTLTENLNVLPDLSSRAKRQLSQEAQSLFSDNPEMVRAIESWLNPDKPYSVISRTLFIIADYIVNIGRLVASPFTGNIKQPLKDLEKNILKDLARIVRFIYGCFACVGHIIYAVSYTPFRAATDGFFNGFLARLEGFVRGNKHSLSSYTTEAASYISGSYAKMREFFQTPALVIEKSVTYGDAGAVAGAHIEKIHSQLFKREDELKKECKKKKAPIDCKSLFPSLFEAKPTSPTTPSRTTL